MSNILTPRTVYKPFEYPWAFQAYKFQREMHWTVEEVPLGEDVDDWNRKLTPDEKFLLTQIFRFFTQADVDVKSGYHDEFIPMFKKPELRMMMGAFADMESTHIEAYSLLLETVGMPEAEYSIFQEFSEMKEKHEFYFSADIYENDISNLARKIAIFSAFGEGLQLFSSFAMLLNFQRFNKMKGMGQLITWSVRDESLHVEYMLKIFHEILVDYPHIWNDSFKNDLYEVGKKMVELEFNFIDLAFSNSKIEGMEASEVKDYVCQTADRRFIQLGLQPVYGIKTDPLPWLRSILHAVEHANFFETRATEYSRDTMTGSFEDVWGKFSKLEEPVA